MSDEEQLDRLLAAAAEEWRVAPPVPRDELWSRIEAEAFAAPALVRHRSWPRAALAIAASMLIGVALGRGTAGVALPGPAPVVALDSNAAMVTAASYADNAYARPTEELLGRTALLLAALPDAGLGAEPTSAIAQQGSELLTTTRVLLDSPAGVPADMRNLLEDLELVLVQVARLHAPGSRDLDLIHDALDRHDIVPRLREAVIGSAEALN